MQLARGGCHREDRRRRGRRGRRVGRVRRINVSGGGNGIDREDRRLPHVHRQVPHAHRRDPFGGERKPRHRRHRHQLHRGIQLQRALRHEQREPAALGGQHDDPPSCGHLAVGAARAKNRRPDRRSDWPRPSAMPRSAARPAHSPDSAGAPPRPAAGPAAAGGESAVRGESGGGSPGARTIQRPRATPTTRMRMAATARRRRRPGTVDMGDQSTSEPDLSCSPLVVSLQLNAQLPTPNSQTAWVETSRVNGVTRGQSGPRFPPMPRAIPFGSWELGVGSWQLTPSGHRAYNSRSHPPMKTPFAIVQAIGLTLPDV